MFFGLLQCGYFVVVTLSLKRTLDIFYVTARPARAAFNSLQGQLTLVLAWIAKDFFTPLDPDPGPSFFLPSLPQNRAN